MEIFINEISLQGQYPSEKEFVDCVKIFIGIFELIESKKIQNRQIYKQNNLLFVNYEAIKGSNFNASLRGIRDKSLYQQFRNIIFNRQNPKEWQQERLHSSSDSFDYLHESTSKNVTDTSLAEVAERQYLSKDTIYLVINFKDSIFNCEHPHIKDCCIISIIKNNDETQIIHLDGIDSQPALENWLEEKLSLSRIGYDLSSKDPPLDMQTILIDNKKFEYTQRIHKPSGRKIYREILSGRYWYVDNLHFGQKSHIEVFDPTGKHHVGEATLKGDVDRTKADPDKKSIDI